MSNSDCCESKDTYGWLHPQSPRWLAILANHNTSLVFAAPLWPQVFVKWLLAAPFGCLYIVVFRFKAFCLSLQSHSLLNKGFLAVFLCNAPTEKFSWPLDYCSNLRERRKSCFPAFLFIMSFRIQDWTHSEKLEISFQLWCYFCLG